MFFPVHFTTANGALTEFRPSQTANGTGRWELVSCVVPDRYSLNYNTKRDYQMELKSGILTGPKFLRDLLG